MSMGRNFLLYGDRKRVEVLTGEESVNGKIGLRERWKVVKSVFWLIFKLRNRSGRGC